MLRSFNTSSRSVAQATCGAVLPIMRCAIYVMLHSNVVSTEIVLPCFVLHCATCSQPTILLLLHPWNLFSTCFYIFMYIWYIFKRVDNAHYLLIIFIFFISTDESFLYSLIPCGNVFTLCFLVFVFMCCMFHLFLISYLRFSVFFGFHI